MTDHPSAQLIDQYDRRMLTPDLFLVVHEHLRSCPECGCRHTPAPASEDYVNLLSSFLPDPDDEPYHLSREEAIGYLNHGPGDIGLELAESHLASCARCNAYLAELEPGERSRTSVSEAHLQSKQRRGLWPVVRQAAAARPYQTGNLA